MTRLRISLVVAFGAFLVGLPQPARAQNGAGELSAGWRILNIEEETFLVGQRNGIHVRQPFWDPDLIEFMVRVRPLGRSEGGLSTENPSATSGSARTAPVASARCHSASWRSTVNARTPAASTSPTSWAVSALASAGPRGS